VPSTECRADRETSDNLRTTFSMTWVKICGMTNLEDALTAVDAGADAVGFVFYEKSPRNISIEVAREIVEKLPESVEKIGVFVKGGNLDAADVLLNAGLTGAQTYVFPGRVDPRNVGAKAIGSSLLPERARFIMALSLKARGEGGNDVLIDFSRWKGNSHQGFSLPEGLMDTFLLDSGDLRTPGGTGKTFDWKKAVPIAEGMRRAGLKLVVAGGLTPDNVAGAMSVLSPWGVDVVSGVEARPGKKDPEKVRAFVKAVRDADRKAN
jgi:phosphoribosylanthranilate isomerase